MANISTTITQAASGANSTITVMDEAEWLAARSIRSSTIILASFNIVAASATAMGILCECYSREKRNGAQGREKTSVLFCVKGSSTFPFILSFGILVQGIIFAVSQSRGLDNAVEAGCSLVGQFMFPAIFIVPFTQLIFGLEVAMQSLRNKPFPPRGRWNVVICLAVLTTALLVTGLVATFVRAPDICFASLFWFVSKWAEGGFILIIVIIVGLILSMAMITGKLTRHSNIGSTERIDASSMVYYLAMAFVYNSLLLPFFGYLTFGNPKDTTSTAALTLSMIATVVANVSGLMTGCLHLFLRSYTATIMPRIRSTEFQRQQLKDKIKVHSPVSDHSSHGLDLFDISRSSGHSSEQDGHSRGRTEIQPEKTLPPLPRSSVPSAALDIGQPESDAVIPPPLKVGVPANAQQTISTSLGPRSASSPNNNTPMSNVDQFMLELQDLGPPPSIQNFERNHRRDSSTNSSATVQIGLRLSNLAEMTRKRSALGNNPERLSDMGGLGAMRPSPLATSTLPPDTRSTIRNSVRQADRTSVTAEESPLRSAENPAARVTSSMGSPSRAKTPSPRGVGFKQRQNFARPQDTVPSSPNRQRPDVTQDREGWI